MILILALAIVAVCVGWPAWIVLLLGLWLGLWAGAALTESAENRG